MDGREDSVLSDSPPSAGEPDSDYEAPARIKQTLKPRRRSKPRVALRSRKRRVSQTSFQLDEEDPDVFEDQVLLDVVDDDSDLEDARFRSSGRRDRPGRTQIDHDVIEGLPIRQWKQIDAPVGPPPVIQQITGKNAPWPELPMPRDWQMLPEVSQQLLRAARAGKLYKPPTPPNEEEEKHADVEAEPPAKDTPKGFMTRKWSQIPRHLEGPEPEHLAKRRKGLSSAYASGAGQQGQPPQPPAATRMTKVRKTDADGNPVVYEVQALEGQPIEGEIVEEVATEAAPVVATVAPGTVIDGVGVANADGLVVAAADMLQPAQSRRKPPPPRRKKNKGPGRGHKKVVVLEPGMEGAAPGQTTVIDSNGQLVAAELADGATPADGDTPMPDAREGDEEESGEEGDEGDEDDEGSEEGELAQTPTPDGSVTPSRSIPPAPAPTSAPTSAPAPAVIPESTSELLPLDSAPGSETTLSEQPPVEPSAEPPVEPNSELPVEPPTELPAEPPTEAPAEPLAERPAEPPAVQPPAVQPLAEQPHVEQPAQPPTQPSDEPPATDTVESAPSEPTLPPVEPLSVQSTDTADTATDQTAQGDESSSPDEPLASANSHSRHGSLSQASLPPLAPPVEPTTEAAPLEKAKTEAETDLFGSLEKHLEGQETQEPET